MVSSRAASLVVQAALAAALLLAPTVFGDYFAYQIGLYLLFGIATQGVALCWGQAGFLNLGQAIFFGLGAYMSGLILRSSLGGSPVAYAALLLCVLVPAALAYLVGHLVFARRLDSGAFFSLITLALAMLATLLANQWREVTGGFNGLSAIPDLPGSDRYSSLYYVIALAAIGWTAIMNWLLRRPLGTLWLALSQNEDRLQFFGFATHRLKALAFAIGAGGAGCAGALYAPHEGIVTPQAVGILLSAQFVIWSAVGGRKSPTGALLGAVGIGVLSAALRERYPFWEAIVALVFLGVVLGFPDGLAGLASRLWRRWSAGSTPLSSAAEAAPRNGLAAPVLRYGLPPVSARTSSSGYAAASAEPRDALEAPGLRFEAVRVRRGAVAILNGLEMNVMRLGVSCLIGPNGAGKTSAFNVLTGRLPLDAGRIRFDRQDVSNYPAWRMARLGVGRKFQIPSVFAQLSVGENLLIALWANRLGPFDGVRAAAQSWHSTFSQGLLARLPMLTAQSMTPAGSLSQGARQMLEFAMVALMEPRLFLLDEPCAGLSSNETRQMMQTIVWAVRELGASALLIEHDMSAVEAVSGHVFVLHQGRLLAEGSLAEVKASAEVRAVYAGGRK